MRGFVVFRPRECVCVSCICVRERALHHVFVRDARHFRAHNIHTFSCFNAGQFSCFYCTNALRTRLSNQDFFSFARIPNFNSSSICVTFLSGEDTGYVQCVQTKYIILSNHKKCVVRFHFWFETGYLLVVHQQQSYILTTFPLYIVLSQPRVFSHHESP